MRELKNKNKFSSITAKDIYLREKSLKKIISLEGDKEKIFDEEIERVRRMMN
jgi:hypothetical protein